MWALLIIVLSFAPQEEFNNKSMDNLDKIVHLFLYAVLSHLGMIAFLKQNQYRFLRRNAAPTIFFLVFVLGLLIELFQGTVFVSRSTEVMDLLANTMGSLLGLVSFYMIYKNLKK